MGGSANSKRGHQETYEQVYTVEPPPTATVFRPGEPKNHTLTLVHIFSTTATSLQRSLSSVPKVAVVQRFNCIKAIHTYLLVVTLYKSISFQHHFKAPEDRFYWEFLKTFTQFWTKGEVVPPLAPL